MLSRLDRIIEEVLYKAIYIQFVIILILFQTFVSAMRKMNRAFSLYQKLLYKYIVPVFKWNRKIYLFEKDNNLSKKFTLN